MHSSVNSGTVRLKDRRHPSAALLIITDKRDIDMGYILTMALRNIARNRRRSFLAALSVTISIVFVVVTKGMINGLLDSMVKNFTKNETGHIRITTKEFERKSRFYPVTENIASSSSLIESIKNNPTVKPHLHLVTERTLFGVLLSHNGFNRQALAFAGDPEKEKELMLLDRSIMPGGRYIQAGKEMLMGYKLARSLKYTVGDQVSVVTSGSDWGLHLKKFTIVGLFKTGLNMFDDGLFQIPLVDGKNLLRSDSAGQQIIIMLKKYQESETVSRLIAASISDTTLSVKAWSQIGDYPQFMAYARTMYNLIHLIIVLLGSFIISNIMMMVVMERKREIGILKSMGMPQNEILVLFLTEGTILGGMGSVVGTVIGAAIASYFAVHGADFSSLVGEFNFPIDSMIYFRLGPETIVQCLGLGIIIAA
ncbi:MAG: ABC transporter permease, partial [Chitinivibrionales bacterium]|nr:ABC transporter permease [Chitinivibrionales bacterium]